MAEIKIASYTRLPYSKSFGAAEQHLLKLLEHIIDTPALSAPALPEIIPHVTPVIY